MNESDRILVIPDVHLKGWMFEEADRLMKEHGITQAVCLGDLVDDWDMQMNTAAYMSVFQKVFAFDEKHPNTLWCCGNHDVSYLWGLLETGYSPYQEALVCDNVRHMQEQFQERLQFAHVIGNCLFTHAGVTWEFLDKLRYRGFNIRGICSIEDLKEIVNQCTDVELWWDNSPLWVRPTYEEDFRIFAEYGVLQVTGHTPVKKMYLTKGKELLFCDSFSTYQNGSPIGTQEFPVVTKSGEWIASLAAQGTGHVGLD
ncbi:MAG: metallophosphoesterase [Lachnospiraceae bacterium]|nr:metallophosphoesterase [Lachnospiraceae bacterium]